MFLRKISVLKLYKFLLPCFCCFVFYSQQATAQTVVKQEQNNSANVTQSTSLTGYVKGEETANQPVTDEKKDDDQTWVGSLVDKVTQKGADIISPNVAQNNQNKKRSNASVFDISGVMLRMSYKQAADALTKRGYKITSAKYEIPNFIRWRYEEMCRNQGVVCYERLASCVTRLAKKNNYQYVYEAKFDNFKTKETVSFFLTSNFTGNKVFKIIYQSEAANIRGSGPKADYLRNIKIYDFWKKINQKYGYPDNQEQVIWGMGENKPFLQAATGRLLLYDKMLQDLDYTRMSREDQKFMNTAVYTF